MKTDIESGIGIYQADAADMVDKPGIWVIHRLFDKLNIFCDSVESSGENPFPLSSMRSTHWPFSS